MAKDTAVLSPNLGLYLGRSPLTVPSRGLSDGRNFRIENGTLTNINLGWDLYSALDFGNPVTLIDTFIIRGNQQRQIIGTTTDLFNYDAETDTAVYINPIYDTGTVGFAGNDTFTKSLLHFPGADASTTITDSNFGGSAHTWTARGNAQIDTSQFKFGGTSLQLDGTGDFVDTPDSADWALGTSDFTIDFWFRCNAAGGSAIRLCGQFDAALTPSLSSFGITREASNIIQAYISDGSGYTVLAGTTQFTNAVNTGWHHCAVQRSGTSFVLFVDGVVEAATVTSITVPNSTELLGVGSWGGSTAGPWNGWIDEFRFSLGSARYAGTFTPTGGPYSLAGTVTGEGTSFVAAGIKTGDFIHFGSDNENDPTLTWYEITTVDSATQLTLAAGPTPPVGPLYTIRVTATGGVTDLWETATFVAPDDGTGDDLWFATNGVDYVVTWDGNADQVVVQSALGFKCRELNVYKNMMLYANLIMDGGDIRPTTFINSDIQKPLDVTNGLAGEFRAHSGTDQILTLSNLGDNLAIYSEETVTLIQFVGDPLIFVFRDVSNGVGLLGQRLQANFGDYHEFLSADSQYLFDGATINEVGKQLWREVLNNRDQTRRPLGHTHFALERGELHWIVALTSDANSSDSDAAAEQGYIEHYLEEVGDRVPTPFSNRDSPWLCSGYGVTGGALTFDEVTDTWEDVAFRWNDNFLFAAFPISLMGSADGHVYKINGAQNGNGTPLVSYVTTGRKALGDGRMRALLTRVYPFSENTMLPLDVTVRLCDHAEGAITTSDVKIFDGSLVEGGHFVSPFRVGRYFELKFGTNGTAWALSGYDTDIRAGGFR
jgi:hypothetical protein